MKFKSMLGHSALYLLASSATMLSVQAASADDKKHGVMAAGEIVWAPFDPSQPKGMQIAVLHGDPSKAGPFGVRLKIPAGLELGSHTHSNAEYVTIISGKAKYRIFTQFLHFYATLLKQTNVRFPPHFYFGGIENAFISFPTYFFDSRNSVQFRCSGCRSTQHFLHQQTRSRLGNV